MITMISTMITTIPTITMYQVRHPDGSLAISFPDGSNKRISAGGEEEVAHLTSPHLTPPHLTPPHLTSPHLTSPHLG